ncbi:MAG: hypothetical protein IT453_03020 [Planctomycetes bacterium]|nr:hypothetical protein [Planctomycetota bacterium]
MVGPTVVIARGHQLGSILGGVAPEAALAELDASPEHALGYRIRVEYVELDPRGELPSAAAAARLFATLRGGEPIAATGRLTLAARLARGDGARRLAERLAAREFGRTRELARLEGALPAGTLGALTLTAEQPVPTPTDGPLRKSLRCEAARAADFTATVALALLDLAPPPLADPREASEEAAERAPEPARVLDEVIVLADALDAANGPLAWVLPSPFVDGEGSALVVFVEALGPSNDAAAVERTLADCRDALADTQQRAQRVDDVETRRQELASALGSLGAAANRRSSLLFLAQATGAALAGDLALAADETALDAYVKSLPSTGDELARVVVDGSTLGFVLERGAYAFLAKLGSETPLAPELSGALVRRAGEAGRSSGAIEDLLAGAKTVADLERAALDSNRIALEDSTLAVRVRGFDWLAARGLAPAGYDPFGEAQARRAALEAAEATR